MLLSCLLNISSVLSVPQCTPVSDGIVLNKYYLETCSACKRLSPIFDEIKSQAAKMQLNIKFREVECTECECEGITNFPTLEITQDKVSKGKSIGFKEYNKLANWIKETLNIKGDVFQNHIEHEQGEVKSLVAKDFLTGFENEWLILFYENNDDPRRKLIQELAKIFKDRVNIAEASKEESRNVTVRYGISEYPLIMALNQGTAVPYAGKADLPGLTEFTEKLASKAFKEITYTDLKEKTKDFNNGNPVYVVLYKNFELASHYFNDLAQQFKFKATIYRSSDPEMFAAAGYTPKDFEDFEKDPDHNKMVYLSVYKNGSFFMSPEKLDDTPSIISWIFHTHFGHVTNINNENFYTVFHGIKPVVLLLTKNDLFLENFNKLSATFNLGVATSNLIFATLDTVEYPLFKQMVLKGVKEPAVVFFDPITSRWFYKSVKFTDADFSPKVMEMIDQYFNNRLPVFPAKKSKFNLYIAGPIVAALIALVYRMNTIRKRVD